MYRRVKMEFNLKIDRDTTKKFDYKTAKIAGFKTLSQMGLPSGYFGGRVHRIAELKDKDEYLVLDHISNVIGVLEPVKIAVKKVEKVEEVIEEVKEELEVEEVVIKCDKCGKECKTEMGLKAHARFCKG